MRSVVTLLLWLLLFLLQIVAKSLSYSRNTSLFSSGQCSIYVASFILTGPNLCGCCTLDIASCNHISIPLSHSHSVSPAHSLISYVYFMRPAPFSLGSLIDVARINQAIWAASFVWCWSSDLLPKYSYLPLSFLHIRFEAAINRLRSSRTEVEFRSFDQFRSRSRAEPHRAAVYALRFVLLSLFFSHFSADLPGEIALPYEFGLVNGQFAFN